MGEVLPQEELDASSFGVRLFMPVDFYQKCERGEIRLPHLPHVPGLFPLRALQRAVDSSIPVPDGGLRHACLFYLLFLALFRAHRIFASYAIASCAVMALITDIQREGPGNAPSRRRDVRLFFGLYSVLFVLLENEDYALSWGRHTFAIPRG